MPATRFQSLILLGGFALLSTGCVGYRLGSMLPEDVESVHVPIAKNLTGEPLLNDDLTRAVLAEIQRDGSLRIEQESKADAVLYVNITHYELEPLSYAQDNRVRPNEYRLLLRAKVEMVRREGGQTLVRSDTLEGRSTFPLNDDLTAGKRRGLPDAADDLARKIVSAVSEAWPEGM